MAGHNKWSKIKRKKGVNDAKRGALFTKLIREITVAAKEGGGSVEFNARLRLGVETAKAASMQKHLKLLAGVCTVLLGGRDGC